ncbi:MAG: DUF115 domain-containing protein [Spirochaetia bacterium]|nr:DUF115 domain-containing protein [Spirochaetia bacterium]
MSANELQFNKNLAFLESKKRILSPIKNLLLAVEDNKTNWAANTENVLANGFEKNGIWYHSRRDPQREGVRQMENTIDSQTRHLIFLSAGIGYPFMEAMKNPQIESILVFETDPETLFYCLSLSDILHCPKKIYIYYCPDPQMDTLEDSLVFFQNKNLNAIRLYKHRASFQIHATACQNLEDQLDSIMYKRSINQATIIKFQGIWNKNIVLNMKQLLQGKKLGAIIETLKGQIQNVVVCGAGPSLSESFSDLRENRLKFFLIAADTAFMPLIKNNIFPDIVISADPQWLNHYFAMNPEANRSIWIMDPVVCYQSSHYLDKIQAPVFWWDNPFYMDLVIRQNESRGEIAHGGSVSTNAFDLAIKLHPENIILTGQDLSFSDKLAHVKGSVLEAMVYNKNTRFSGFEMHNFFQMRAIPPRKVEKSIADPDNSAKPEKNGALFTNDKLRVFSGWFQEQAMKVQKSGIHLYNATQRGAYLEGFTHKSLRDIVKNSANESCSLDLIMNGERPANDQKAVAALKNILKECKRLENLYLENFQFSRAAQGAGNARLNDIYKKLDANDNEIKKYSHANEALSINAQNIILTITEQDNNDQNAAMLFYKFMYLSARKINYLLKKILK